MTASDNENLYTTRFILIGITQVEAVVFEVMKANFPLKVVSYLLESQILEIHRLKWLYTRLRPCITIQIDYVYKCFYRKC